jgi:hypothetical protein
MVMAADYPFMDVLAVADIFRRHDIGGWAKAPWVI